MGLNSASHLTSYLVSASGCFYCPLRGWWTTWCYFLSPQSAPCVLFLHFIRFPTPLRAIPSYHPRWFSPYSPDEMFQEIHGRFVKLQDRYPVLRPEVSYMSQFWTFDTFQHACFVPRVFVRQIVVSHLCILLLLLLFGEPSILFGGPMHGWCAERVSIVLGSVLGTYFY